MNEAAVLVTKPGALPESTNHAEWRVRCSDMMERDRCLTVLADSGRITVVGPPGETAVLSSGQLAALRAALAEAAVHAEGSR